MKIKNYLELKDLYLGRDVIIIGNGPDLLNLNEKFKKNLNNFITIGCNISHLFYNEINFHVSGHWTTHLYNLHFGKVKDCRLFQGPTLNEMNYFDNNTLNVENINVVTRIDKFKKPKSDEMYLVGSEQIGLAALHLAYILGAKRIFFIGVDMKSSKHYYDCELYSNNLINQWNFLYEKYKDNIIVARDLRNMKNVVILNGSEIEGDDGNIIKKQSYFENYNDTLNNYSEIFKLLKSENVEVFTGNKNSIICEAGADYVNLNNLI